MSTTTTAAPPPVAQPKPPRRGPFQVEFWRRHGFGFAVLVPSLILIAIFVYGFIGYSIRVSMSQWQGLLPNLTPREPLYQTYVDLFHNPRWQADLRNVFVFTFFFLALSVLVGLLLALLVHNALAGAPIFRTIFLFPYSLSFIVTGVVWRWIFTPSAGANLLLNAVGIDPGPKWITDPKVVGDVSGALEAIIPGGDFIQVKLGIPLALLPIVIAASWQLAGFAMATMLAALGTLPDELKEAASLDGAGTVRYHWHIVLPWLRPAIVVILVILGHVSLKSFDFVYAMSGQGPGFATDVPGIFVFEQTFRALRFNLGAAASMIMFLLVAAVIVPYLYRSLVREERS